MKISLNCQRFFALARFVIFFLLQLARFCHEFSHFFLLCNSWNARAFSIVFPSCNNNDLMNPCAWSSLNEKIIISPVCRILCAAYLPTPCILESKVIMQPYYTRFPSIFYIRYLRRSTQLTIHICLKPFCIHTKFANISFSHSIVAFYHSTAVPCFVPHPLNLQRDNKLETQIIFECT